MSVTINLNPPLELYGFKGEIAKVTGFGITITFILLALCGVYCFAVVRWTRGLPVWLRRLTRSFLLALLCPGIAVQEDGVPFAPLLFFLTFGLPGLKGDDIERIIIQVLIVWGAVYVWMIFIGLPMNSESPAKRRLVRLKAIACSFVSWIAIAALINYWINLDTWSRPSLDWFTVIFFSTSILCALVSMTLVLFSMSEHDTIPSDILWTLWAACPAVVAMSFGIWYWFQTTFFFYWL